MRKRVVAVGAVDLHVLGAARRWLQQRRGSAAAGRAGTGCRCAMPIASTGTRDAAPCAGVDAAPAAADVVQVHRLGRAAGSGWRRSGARACRRGSRGSARPRSAATARSRRSSGSASSRPKRSVNTSSVRNVIWATMPGDGQALVRAVAGRGVVVVAAAPAWGRVRMARRPDAPTTRSAARWPRRRWRSGRATRTRSGYMTPHSSTCMPPIEPPTTLSHRSIAEVVGERGLRAHHVADRDRPGSASRRAGRSPGRSTPDRWSPGSRRATLAHTTKQRSVSSGRPGPISALPPARRSGGRARPARRRGCRR